MRILLVEDDEMTREGLVDAFSEEGWQVLACASVAQVRAVLAGEMPALAVVDMQLSDGDGFDVAAQLGDVPVIFLTVMDDEDRIVRAFENGAVDYVTKPFRLRELLARMKRHLPQSVMCYVGRVALDEAAGVALVDGVPLALTALEYRLLEIFAHHPGQLLSRAQILNDIWDRTGNFVEDNTLSVYMKRLRDKLGNAATIETVRGRGYRVH